MNIVLMRPEHAEPLLAIYRAQVAGAPHCCLAPDQARFCDDLLSLTPPVTRLYPPPRAAQVFVAEAAGIVHGFATLVTYDDDEAAKAQQAITGLFFTDESAGHALVRACAAQAPGAELGAFPNTHGNTLIQAYNAGWDGLSDRIPRVAQILAQQGFVPYARELHLAKSLQDREGGSSSLPAVIRLTAPQTPKGNYGAMYIQALDGESVVGDCFYNTLDLLTNNPGARHIGYIGWLHVKETHRRRGIARALMTVTARELVRLGCTTCWLTTAADNWAAQSFYFKLGFDVVDCSVSLRKPAV